MIDSFVEVDAMKATVTLCEQVNVGTPEKAEIKLRPVIYRNGQPLAPEDIVAGSRGTYYLRFSEDGQRKTPSLGTSDLRVAQLAHSTALARFPAGIRPLMGENALLADFKTHAPEQSAGTWRSLCHAFTADQDLKLVKGEITRSSQRRYLRSLKRLNEWFEKKVTFLSEINTDLFNSFVLDRIKTIKAGGRSGRSYKLDVKVAKMGFGLAVEKEWMSTNPVQKMKATKKRKGDMEEDGDQADPYSREELQTMLNNLNGEALMFWLLYQTGLRRIDAGNLKWGEVNMETGKINTVAQKNARAVRLPIPPELKAELEKEIKDRYGKGVEPIQRDFVLFRYTPSDPGQSVYDMIKRLGKSAGMKQFGPRSAKPHRFRDSFGAVCFLKGMSTEQVAAYLGDTIKVVEKHNSKFIPERQDQPDEKFLSKKDPLLATA